jgi:hypothetical protein
MDDNFKLRAALKSDDELQEYVDNREKYLPDSVDAAVAELQSRGVEFSDEELQVIAEDMQARRAAIGSQTNSTVFFYDPEKIKQVEDENVPLLFSKRAIYGFTVLSSLFFGSILLAINVSKTKNQIGIVGIILYGCVISFGAVAMVLYYHLNPSFVLIINILGTYPLNNFFWNRYVGRDTLYRVRPIWIPLIIWLILLIWVGYVFLNINPAGLK